MSTFMDVTAYRTNRRVKFLCDRLMRRANLTADQVYDIQLWNNHHWILHCLSRNEEGKRYYDPHTEDVHRYSVRLRATPLELRAVRLALSNKEGGEYFGSDTRTGR